MKDLYTTTFLFLLGYIVFLIQTVRRIRQLSPVRLAEGINFQSWGQPVLDGDKPLRDWFKVVFLGY